MRNIHFFLLQPSSRGSRLYFIIMRMRLKEKPLGRHLSFFPRAEQYILILYFSVPSRLILITVTFIVDGSGRVVKGEPGALYLSLIVGADCCPKANTFVREYEEIIVISLRLAKQIQRLLT